MAITNATLSSLKNKLIYAVGTAETNLLTADKRTDAINDAIIAILSEYPIPQYTITVTLSFTSGSATAPADMLVPFQLRDTANDINYDQVDFEKFQLNLPYTYNIYYDDNAGYEKIRIYTQDTTSLEFTYIVFPEPLADASDTIRFKPWWNKAIVEKAAEQLFISVQNFPAAQAKSQVADDYIAKAWQVERTRLQGVQDTRLQSIYERRDFLLSGVNLRN